MKGSLYQPQLDSIRFFAFLGVFVFHAVPHDPSYYLQHHVPGWLVSPVCTVSAAGAFGVDLFFVLSAYLITMLLLREKELRGNLDVRSFYIRRMLRIWPLYFSFIAIAAFVLPLWSRIYRIDWAYVAGYVLLAGNWIYVWKGLPATIAIPLWSISIEEQFYLGWPLVVRRVSRETMMIWVAGLLFAGTLCRFLLLKHGASGREIEYNTLARIDPIALGILLACLSDGKRIIRSITFRSVLIVSGVALWLLAAALCKLNDPGTQASFWGTLLGRPAVAIGAAAMVLGLMQASESGFKILRHDRLTRLGRLSYGLYVFHMAGLLLARQLFPVHGTMGFALYVILGFVFTLALSTVSYRWLELPFLKLKERFAIVKSRPL